VTALDEMTGGMFGGSKSLAWSKYGNLSDISKKILQSSGSKMKESSSDSKKKDEKVENAEQKDSTEKSSLRVTPATVGKQAPGNVGKNFQKEK